MVFLVKIGLMALLVCFVWDLEAFCFLEEGSREASAYVRLSPGLLQKKEKNYSSSTIGKTLQRQSQRDHITYKIPSHPQPLFPSLSQAS